MQETYNFSAGPATLPEPVLEEVQRDLLSYKGTGISVMEMSHRSKAFETIIQSAEETLRDLLQIPNSYHVLFLQGGATLQFSMVPLNLAKSGKMSYVNTGSWASKAYKEALSLGYDARIAASSEPDDFRSIPDLPADLGPDLDYLHITSNNTIYGSQYTDFPIIEGLPLVADMSSDFLSRPFNIEDFGLVYAGAQKNVGPAGVTLVILREDVLGPEKKHLPTYLNYQVHMDKKSMYNTPPTFAIYVTGLVLKWIKDQGGLSAMADHNQAQAEKIYAYLDQSQLFHNHIRPQDRSHMNITFTTGQEALDQAFIQEAEERGLLNLKGHRSVQGMRASIYNAFPDEGIDALLNLLEEFEENHYVQS